MTTGDSYPSQPEQTGTHRSTAEIISDQRKIEFKLTLAEHEQEAVRQRIEVLNLCRAALEEELASHPFVQKIGSVFGHGGAVDLKIFLGLPVTEGIGQIDSEEPYAVDLLKVVSQGRQLIAQALLIQDARRIENAPEERERF